MHRSTALTLALLLFSPAAHAAPEDLQFFTDFEDIVPNTGVGEVIVVGETAEFAGDAFGGRVGDFSIYFSGLRAWMVVQDGTGVIDFPVGASEVQFWATAHPSANGDTIVTAFDELGGTIGSPVVLSAGEGFNLVSFSGVIDSIEVVNEASNQLNGIDDFGFTALPEPASTTLLVAGGLLLSALHARQRAG